MTFMKLKKFSSLVAISMIGSLALAGCSSNPSTEDATKSTGDVAKKEPVVIVWYPNESGGDLEEARNAVGEVIEEAIGREVEHKLTTDYAVAIEAIANDKAHLSFMGPQGYVEANAKNNAVLPVVVPSGSSGTLDDAVYYSWLAVKTENEENYKVNGEYAIDAIEGQRMSFVSNSSTSGFKVPSTSIVGYFSQNDAWKNLIAEDLMEGGSDKFFSEVLFGGSHQGSAVNLLTDKSDVAAFCDTCLANYTDVTSGDENAVGSTYSVKNDAEEPFNNLGGEQFTLISSTPVLNSPIVMNTNLLTAEEQQSLIEMLTSDEVTNNEAIFVPKDSETKGFFAKSDKEQFIAVDDAWFEPIRQLGK